MSSSEMKDQADWVIGLISSYNQSLNGRIGRVVIFGHANSSTFFDPVTKFVEEELHNQLPMLFIQGNLHMWQYKPNFENQPSMLQIVVAGGREPALKVTVNNTGSFTDTATAFQHDRRDRRRRQRR